MVKEIKPLFQIGDVVLLAQNKTLTIMNIFFWEKIEIDT